MAAAIVSTASREGEEPGSGDLVELADVAVVGEGGDRDLGDVVGVDEGLEHRAGREVQRAVDDRLDEERLAEVLVEEARAHHGPLQPRPADRRLGGEGAVLVATRQQHDPAHAGAGGGGDGVRHLFGGAGEGEVGLVGEVDGADVGEGRTPRGGIVPVEGRGAGAGPDADRERRGR